MHALSSGRVIAFLATVDPKRARHFYETILGLRVVHQDEFALALDANGTMIRVQIVSAVGPRPYTALGWQVSDLEATVKILRERGVRFEIYEFLTQDALGVWTAPSGARIAWFKDPDENVLSLTEL